MYNFPYSQNNSHFLALPAHSHEPFVIVGVPFDGAVSHRPGARFAPQAIREASLMLCDGIHPYFLASLQEKVGDGGNMALSNASGIAAVRQEIEHQAQKWLQNYHCVFLGGDHSVTLPLLRKAAQRYGRLALLHFDAHCDTWPDHFGEPSGHGTWLYEAMQEELVAPEKVVQIGLRSSGDVRYQRYVSERGGLIYTARDLRGLDGANLCNVCNNITQQIGNTPCYVTVDIDCLDPAFAPGTGTPEPGGLSSSQLLTFIENLCVPQGLHCIAMDCCEVSPPYDHAQLTSNAAAHIVWTYLAAQIAKPPPSA